jgi:subtilisin family serine protease
MNISTRAALSRRIRRAPFAAVLLAFGLASQAAPDDSVEGEILVRLSSPDALAPLLARHELTLAGAFGARPIYRLRVTGSANPKDVIKALEKEVDVIDAEPNQRQQSPEARKNVVWAIGNAADYAAQWAPRALHLADAQRVSSGAGMRVAVLDTGVDLQHPALAGKLLPGFDFVDGDNDPSEGGGPDDLGYGHGTHVAGLVALVAPGARIMPLRVLAPDGTGNTWALADALLYAADPDGDPATDDGAHVINLSLGSVVQTKILETVAKLVTCRKPEPGAGYASDKARCEGLGGAVVVAAAGNDASDKVREFPAAEGAHGLLAVGASDVSGARAEFSNYGKWVEVAAPGDHITSSVPGGGFGTWSGTSMAAPLAAGTAALVRAAQPKLSAEDVTKLMKRRTMKLCDTKLKQIDALAAVTDEEASEGPCH